MANSKGLAKLAKLTAPDQQVEIVGNGVDISHFADLTKPYSLAENLPCLLITVGRLNAQKNLSCLLEALASLTYENWRLEIVGDGPEREMLSTKAKNLGIAEKITFSGWLDREELLSHLAAADVFVFPSIQEGMPNAVLEAMAAGLPVLACEIEGCEELVVHEQTGLLVPPGNVDAFRDALSRLLPDRDICRRFGENGKLRAEKEYTWPAAADAYLRLCQESISTALRSRK